MKFSRSLALAAMLLWASSTVDAQDALKGWAAYDAGDYKSAIKEWLPLANQENVNAEILLKLGMIYKSGKGEPQDYVEAVKWYRMAAVRGHEYAQYSLGFMYLQGFGILQDNVRAHMWFNIASANGDLVSANWRDEVAAKMTPIDISKAQAMANECFTSDYKNCGDY